MQYEADIGGRLRQVSVHRGNGGFSVTVDGRDHAIDAVRLDAHTLSLLIGTRSYEVTVVPDPQSGQLAVGIGTASLLVGLNGRRGRQRGEDRGSGGHGPERLLAPMPGKIIRVLVRPGDAVRRRQPLVVIEAMKMENELRASRDGIVNDLFVREGQSVDAGAPLLVVASA